MERTITDMVGHELNVGDTICFTISMRIDQKPIVRATVKEFVFGKNQNGYGEYTDWIVPEYIESPDVKWGERECKLPKKVSPARVVKCY